MIKTQTFHVIFNAHDNEDCYFDDLGSCIAIHEDGVIEINGNKLVGEDEEELKSLVVWLAYHYGWEYGGDAPDVPEHQPTLIAGTWSVHLEYDKQEYLKGGCFYAFGKDNILAYCDALAKHWGWMP